MQVDDADTLAIAVEASQALSGEVELPKLIERFTALALEHTGADHGLLILRAGEEFLAHSEARAAGGRVEVVLRRDPIARIAAPESLIRHVIRTRERVILDDASEPNPFSGDDHLRNRKSGSILCLPLVKQSQLAGIVFLENTLASHAFTRTRTAVVELLAVQAAVSLERHYPEQEVRANELRLREMAADLDRRVAQRTKELAEANAELRLQAEVLQRLPVSAWTLRPDGRPDYVNEVWLEFAGQTLEFVRSYPEAWMTVVHPDDRERAAKMFWNGVSNGQGFAIETRSRRSEDGVYRWHLQQAVVLRDAQGEVLKFVGATTDIDDQKRAEEEVRANELRLREMAGDLDRRVAQRTKELAETNEELRLQVEILQRLPVAAWTLRPDGRPDFVNEIWLEFTGQTLEFVRSYPEAWMTAVHPDDRETAAKIFWNGVRSGQDFAIETRTRRARDGTYRRQIHQAVVLRDTQGKILKFVGTSTDIDDQKRAEEAFRQAQGDLARINRVTTMGELAASMAHELRQPIAGVITNANVGLRKLRHEKPDLDELRTIVTRIGRDAQRAAEMIARIHSHFEKDSPKLQTLDVNEIIPETVALLRDEAVRYGIAIRTNLAADLPHIRGDRVQLHQVAMNLIVNSIEAMKEVDGTREIVIRSQRDETERIIVSFIDTGVGLPPHLAEQIFEPFVTTKAHGTGMGLRISKSIVESHGGRLWAESVSGPGAVFHLSLPIPS